MSKIAVVKTGGKQYKVKEGQTLKVEKLDAKEGKALKMETLMTASTDGKELDLGKPSLGKKVEAKVIEQGKDAKVKVIKFKNKTRYLRNKGHRQLFTKLEITKIS